MSNTVTHNWIDPTQDHIDELTATMREDDRIEVLCYGSSVKATLQESVAHSKNAKTWIVDGHVALMCGVAMPQLLGHAIPWALTSPIVEAHPYIFLKGSRYIVGEWKKEFSYMRNFVDSRYTKAVNWLSWLGFTIQPAIAVGPQSVLFHPVEMVS